VTERAVSCSYRSSFKSRSVSRLNFCWPSPVVLGFRSRRDLWPRFLFSSRHVRVYKWGLLFDEVRGRFFCVGTTYVASFAILFRVNCCWPSPAQWFPVSSPAGLMTMFYCLRFETPPTWRARSPYLYPPVTGWPSCIPGIGFPFKHTWLAGLRWSHSNPPPQKNEAPSLKYLLSPCQQLLE
jgi:hypothetical protein